MRSIERTLLAWTLGALCLGALVVALATYIVTLEEMNEVFDAHLKNVAEAVSSYHRANHGSRVTGRVESTPRNDTPDDTEIVTLTWTPRGEQVFTSDARVDMPFTNTEGLSRPMIRGEEWIVYTSVGADGVAQAAQRVAARQEMAGESAAKVFPPLLGLVVVVGGLLVFGLRRGLQPLDRAARDVAQRSARSLAPITLGDVPREIAPLVGSINDLMGRLALAFATQRRFLADAAHELRTPVAALRLQLQWLGRAEDEVTKAHALAELDAGVARSQRLVEQLLHVARTDPDGERLRLQPVDLAERARSVVEAFSLKADRWGIDLGATCSPGQASVWVEGDVEQLTVLLNNLVENALRYTPDGGVVDVEAACSVDGVPMLRVVDNGPGIAEADVHRVFERFHRGADATAQARDGSGSGLGLAIVRAIADRHGAVVSLHTPEGGKGLEVRVRFPAADQSGSSATGQRRRKS